MTDTELLTLIDDLQQKLVRQSQLLRTVREQSHALKASQQSLSDNELDVSKAWAQVNLAIRLRSGQEEDEWSRAWQENLVSHFSGVGRS